MTYINTDRFIEAEGISIPCGMIGVFTLRAVRSDGSSRERVFKNMILDQGLDFLAQYSDIIGTCRVGTSGAAVSPTQTGLVADMGVTAAGAWSSSNAPAPSYTATTTCTYTFEVGAVVGNVAEVGVFRVNNSTTAAFSRALVVDGSGTPTVFPVLADEQLQVTYNLQWSPPLSDILLTQKIGATTYDVTVRASNVNEWWFDSAYAPISQFSTRGHAGAIGSITSLPSGTTYSPISDTASAYTAGSKNRTFSTTFGPASFNGSLLSVSTNLLMSRWQWQYSSEINKTSAQTLIIPYNIAWDRA